MEPERNGKRPASQGVAGSWRFMYSSPLDWQKRSLPQLAIAQELDALCEAPWRVQVASHEALQQVLEARPAVLHLSAHSVLLAQGETRRALLLEDAQSHGYLMEAEKLKALGPWQDLGLLVLLTCSSFELVKDLGCRAVCCTDQVKDAAASEFLRSFYHFLPTSLLRAFEAGQDALRFGPDAGLRSEAEKFILLGSSEGIPVPVKGTRVAWPRLPRVEDYRCQAHTMADMVDCLSKNQRRVILLRGDEGSGKTATCREFCHHFSGPGRLFGLGVLYLETKEQSSKALSEDALRELFIKAFPLPCDGTRCCLLVLDNIDILEAQEQEELRKSLAGLLRSFHSLRVLLTSRCPLQGWACLDSWKVVEIEIMTLPPEDSACLFLQRCRRPLHHRDFQEDGTEEILQGSCAQQRLQASGILKALNGVPGHIVRAAGCVDALLPSLLEHPMLRPEP